MKQRIEIYEEPNIEVVFVQEQNIVTLSGGDSGVPDSGDYDEIFG